MKELILNLLSEATSLIVDMDCLNEEAHIGSQAFDELNGLVRQMNSCEYKSAMWYKYFNTYVNKLHELEKFTKDHQIRFDKDKLEKIMNECAGICERMNKVADLYMTLNEYALLEDAEGEEKPEASAAKTNLLKKAWAAIVRLWNNFIAQMKKVIAMIKDKFSKDKKGGNQFSKAQLIQMLKNSDSNGTKLAAELEEKEKQINELINTINQERNESKANIAAERYKLKKTEENAHTELTDSKKESDDKIKKLEEELSKVRKAYADRLVRISKNLGLTKEGYYALSPIEVPEIFVTDNVIDGDKIAKLNGFACYIDHLKYKKNLSLKDLKEYQYIHDCNDKLKNGKTISLSKYVMYGEMLFTISSDLARTAGVPLNGEIECHIDSIDAKKEFISLVKDYINIELAIMLVLKTMTNKCVNITYRFWDGKFDVTNGNDHYALRSLKKI